MFDDEGKKGGTHHAALLTSPNSSTTFSGTFCPSAAASCATRRDEDPGHAPMGGGDQKHDTKAGSKVHDVDDEKDPSGDSGD